MKIGILTHHYVNNYGAFLQAYALREALTKEFPSDTVEIIDYVNLKQFVINTCGWFRFYPDRETLMCWFEKIQVPLTFAKARKSFMTLSKRCFSAKQVNHLQYDVIIIGSDEVWNYQEIKSTAKIKFGHGLACKNIIAYAPSVGNSEGDIPDYVRKGLKKFSAISVRDEMTGALVQSVTGATPTPVLDPTFLSGFPGCQPDSIKKPYILFYYCEHLPVEIKTQIFEYAKQHGLAVYGAGECDKRYDGITVNLSPFEWINMFRNAEYVFTGTFHGVVFSILNHQQFKVYLTNKSRIKKVGALLRECSLEGREIDDQFVFNLEDQRNEIDYQAVDMRLEAWRMQSMAYLRETLARCRELQELAEE